MCPAMLQQRLDALARKRGSPGPETVRSDEGSYRQFVQLAHSVVRGSGLCDPVHRNCGTVHPRDVGERRGVAECPRACRRRKRVQRCRRSRRHRSWPERRTSLSRPLESRPFRRFFRARPGALAIVGVGDSVAHLAFEPFQSRVHGLRVAALVGRSAIEHGGGMPGSVERLADGRRRDEKGRSCRIGRRRRLDWVGGRQVRSVGGSRGGHLESCKRRVGRGRRARESVRRKLDHFEEEECAALRGKLRSTYCLSPSDEA